MKTITAFTVAHSITLGGGDARLRPCRGRPSRRRSRSASRSSRREIVNRRAAGKASDRRLPWLVAFAFGLLHGFGFAGALSEVGLPTHAIPLALLFFNVGVELGQLLFVAAVMALFVILRRVYWHWFTRGRVSRDHGRGLEERTASAASPRFGWSNASLAFGREGNGDVAAIE